MPTPSEHIYALIEGYVAGTLSEAQENELVEQLRSSEATRRLYLEYRELDYSLQATLQTDQETALKDLLPAVLSRQAAISSTNVGNPGIPTPLPTGSDPFGNPTSPLQPDSSTFFSTARISALGCIVAIAAVALIALNFSSRQPRPEVGKPNQDSVAINNDSVSPTPSDLLSNNHSLKIDSGRARINLQGAGTVVAEGPTDFEVIGPNRARLNYGNIKVQGAGQSAQSFTVETPLGDVIDWGKEFGLSIQKDKRAKLVVLDGVVDVRFPKASMKTEMITERLTQGDGVYFGNGNSLDRINAICRNGTEIFSLCSEVRPNMNDDAVIIANVSDNIDRQTKKFYEIVHKGLQEDAEAFVDRNHQWNGITQAGMPAYLRNADYVKTFNKDRNLTDRKNTVIHVTLSRPSKLYLFVDDRGMPAQWLTNNFRKTGDKIGLDEGSKVPGHELDIGAGKSVDNKFSIWERIVTQPSTIELGANPKPKPGEKVAMYGIAAVPLDPTPGTNDVQ